MNNSQVDQSKEALHQWALGETYPLLQVMLDIAPMEILEQDLLVVLQNAGITIPDWDGCSEIPEAIASDLRMICPTWSEFMTPSGKDFLWRVIPHLVDTEPCDLDNWIAILGRHGLDLDELETSTYVTLTVVRILVVRYRSFVDPVELSVIEHCISVLASGEGVITERALIEEMHAHDLQVCYMDLIRPLAARYAEVLAQQDTDLDDIMGAMTFTHVNREPG